MKLKEIWKWKNKIAHSSCIALQKDHKNATTFKCFGTGSNRVANCEDDDGEKESEVPEIATDRGSLKSTKKNQQKKHTFGERLSQNTMKVTHDQV